MAIVERESHRISFFVLGVLFAAVTAWMVYDEAVTRRPWKDYQDEFAELALAAARAELAAATEAVSANAEEIAAMKAELETEKARIASPDVAAAYAAAKEKARKAAEALKTEEQSLAFRKGESDEAFYYYSVAGTHGSEPHAGGPPEGAAPCTTDAECAGMCVRVDEIRTTVTALLETGAAAYAELEELGVLEPEPDRAERMVNTVLRSRTPANYCAIPEERALRMKEAEVVVIQELVDLRLLHKVTLLKAVADIDGRIAELTEAIEAFEKPIRMAELKLEKAETFTSEIIQYNLVHLGRVDRCASCHVGINKNGFEDPAVYLNPHRTHPKRDILLGKHPPETFGCTACHDGQGPQTKGIGALGKKYDHAYDDKYWEFPLLDKYAVKNLVDIARSPGGGLWDVDPELATVMFGPSEGANPDGTPAMPPKMWEAANATFFNEAPCLKCHTEQIGLLAKLPCSADTDCPTGFTCTAEEPPQPPYMTDEEYEEKFPEPWPTSCERDDLEGNRMVDYAPTLTRGEEIVAEVGCFGCHPIPRYLDRAKLGPVLDQLALKTNPGWLAEWMRYPKGIRANTRMPNFYPEVTRPERHPIISKAADPEAALAEWTAVREEEVAAMIAFFMSVGLDAGVVPDEVPLAGDATRGEKLFADRGCEGCHAVAADTENNPSKNRFAHFDHGPNLYNVGDKVTPEWAFVWVKNPKALWPGTKMPSMRLPDQEAADVVAYLMTLKTGKTYPPPEGDLTDAALIEKGLGLVRRKGCPGCHDIPTLESEGRIGADLSEFGIKDPHVMDFGNMVEDHHLHNWYIWLYVKLLHPRSYGTERIVTRMPEFELEPEEIQAIMVFLKGNRGPENTGGLYRELSAAEKRLHEGRRLVMDRNCFGCHNIDNWNGALTELKFTGPEMVKGPPSLWREGEKIQGPWAFKFLKDPSQMLRPWLEIRMPSFGFDDTEATNIAGYFAAMEGVPFPYEAPKLLPLGGGRLSEALAVFEELKCKQCHPAAGETVDPDADVDLSALAPDLTLTKERLRSNFIVTWLTDPLSFVFPADTKMPSLFYLGMHTNEEELRRIELLRDYLFIFGTDAATAVPPSAALAPMDETTPTSIAP